MKAGSVLGDIIEVASVIVLSLVIAVIVIAMLPFMCSWWAVSTLWEAWGKL